MVKQLIVVLMLLYTLLLVSCNYSGNKEKIIREKRELNYENFFGKTTDVKEDSLIKKMGIEMNSAFNLYPIYKSAFKNEIRIYFANAFNERFFRELYTADSLVVEILNCKTDRRNDSLFMKIGTSIKAAGKYAQDSLVSTQFLPDLKCLMDKQKSNNVLDGSTVYFIQIKSGAITKEILINEPFETEQKDSDAKNISNFIRDINRKYGFKFYDSWNTIDSLAFTTLQE